MPRPTLDQTRFPIELSVRSDSGVGSARWRRRGARKHILPSLLAAIALIVSAAGPALATASVAKVTGSYTYFAYDDPNEPRAVSVGIQGTDPVQGTFTWTRPAGNYSGPVTCVRVMGHDAWFAGPVTKSPKKGAEGINSVFGYVHDGGTPGRAGDLAFVWGALDDENLAGMEALCASMDTDFYGAWPFTVVAGNVKVRPAS